MSLKTQAIIPAAGLGTRLKAKLPKAFVRIHGLPLLVHTLRQFDKAKTIDSVVLVLPKEFVATWTKKISLYKLKKVKAVVAGGEMRSDSVRYGLSALQADTKVVVVHDAARPLVSAKLIDEAVKNCYKRPAVIAAVPVKPTIKRINPKTMVVEATLDRSLLWEVQTPQVFARDVLEKAHQLGENVQATDDAMLVEHIGVKVHAILGEYTNIKITTADDMKIAAFLLGKK